MSISVGEVEGSIDIDIKKFIDGTEKAVKAMDKIEDGAEATDKSLKDLEKSGIRVGKSSETLSKLIELQNKSLDKNKNKLEDSKKELDENAKKHNDLKKSIEKVNKELDSAIKKYGENSKEVNELGAKLNGLEKEFSQIEKSILDSSKNIDKFEKAIKFSERSISNYEQELNDIEKTFSGVSNELLDVANDFGKFGSSINDIKFDDVIGDALDFGKELPVIGGGIDLVATAAKGAGLALLGMFSKMAYDGAVSFDKAITDLQLNLGATSEEASNLRKDILQFSDGGYAIDSVAEAVTVLTRQFNLTNEEMEQCSQALSILNGLGYDNNEVVMAMTKLVKGWGMTYEEALDYIITGHQEGLNLSNEWLDVLNEYIPNLIDLGLTSQDAFSIMKEGMVGAGLSADKVIDATKEIWLTITDGSTTSREAIEAVGLDYDTLQQGINDGSITGREAIAKVADAIVDQGDKTKQAEAAQAILKGTYEYVGLQGVEAFANIGNEIVNTTGKTDELTQAFENSYEASKQDFSNSFKVLSENIGSLVLPSLTSVMDFLNQMVEPINNIGYTGEAIFNNLGITISNMCISGENAFLGFIGKIHEGIIFFQEQVVNAADFLGMDTAKENAKKALNELKDAHTELANKIGENEARMKENTSNYMEFTTSSYNQTATNTGAATDKMANKNKQNMDRIQSDTSNAMNNSKNKVASDSNQMANDMDRNMNNMANVSNMSLGEVLAAVSTNMGNSVQTMKQYATDLYNGGKNSFDKLKVEAKNDMTEMYLGTQTSFNKTAQAGKRALTDLYLNGSASTEKLANKAIDDWNRISRTYSKTITMTIKQKKHNYTINHAPEPASFMIRPHVEPINFMAIDLPTIDIQKAMEVSNFIRVKNEDMVSDKQVQRQIIGTYETTLNESKERKAKENNVNKNETYNMDLKIDKFINEREESAREFADKVINIIIYKLKREKISLGGA